VTKSRRIRGAGHVARMGERRYASKILVGNLKERDQDVGVDVRMII
jgi:hypothetical protein